MKLSEVCSLALLTLPLVTGPAAQAQNLKQREMITSDKEHAAELAKETNKACGTSISFTIDYPSYAHVLDDDNNQRPWAYLANATDALKSLCRTEDGKAAVQAKIKSVTVSHAEQETESLSGGAFKYTVPYSGHSPETIIKWLKENL